MRSHCILRHSNTHLSSDPGTKPVSRLVWRKFENCWSPERLNYALVCAEGGAVFAVGTPVHKREEKNGERLLITSRMQYKTSLFVHPALQVLKCSSRTQVLLCGGKSTPQWKPDQRVSRLPLKADMSILVATTMAKYSCTEGVVVKRRSCFKTWLAMILVCESMIIIYLPYTM